MLSYGPYNYFELVTSQFLDDLDIHYAPFVDVIFSGALTAELLNFDTGEVLAEGVPYEWEINGITYNSVRLSAPTATAGITYIVKVDGYYYTQKIQTILDCGSVNFTSEHSCSNKFHDWDSDSEPINIALPRAAMILPEIQTRTTTIISQNGATEKPVEQIMINRIEYVGIPGFYVLMNGIKINDSNQINTGSGVKEIRNIAATTAEQLNGRYATTTISFQLVEPVAADSCCFVVNLDDIINPENPDNNNEDCVGFTVSIVDTDGVLSVDLDGEPEGPAVYRWYRNGVLISTGATANATESGSYSVIVQIGGCQPTATYVIVNECEDFAIQVTALNGIIAATASNVPTGESVTWSILFNGVEVATSLPYEVEESGTYFVYAEAGECTRVRGIYVELAETDCDFTIGIIDSGALLEAVTDAPTPTYTWYKDVGLGKVEIGIGATVPKQGSGVYFLEISQGECTRDAYILLNSASDIRVINYLYNVSGTTLPLYDIPTLLITNFTQLTIIINGLPYVYTANPLAQYEYGINDDGELIVAPDWALSNATVRAVYEPIN